MENKLYLKKIQVEDLIQKLFTAPTLTSLPNWNTTAITPKLECYMYIKLHKKNYKLYIEMTHPPAAFITKITTTHNNPVSVPKHILPIKGYYSEQSQGFIADQAELVYKQKKVYHWYN